MTTDPSRREGDAEKSGPTASRAPQVYAATLRCENCGAETPHRILRLAPVHAPGTGQHLSGTARCRTCGWTHRFVTDVPSTVEVPVVVSEGPRSTFRRLAVPGTARIVVRERLPGSDDPLEVQKIETRTGRSVSSARPDEAATIWATRDLGARVPVSVVEGARTWTDHLVAPKTSRLAVGDPLTIRGEPVRVVGLRARGRTWRVPGDSFVASEVDRIYARRTDTPPAGRRRSSVGRGTPRSRARDASIDARSRSGPGVMRTRAFPRPRKADGGAAVQRVSPS